MVRPKRKPALRPSAPNARSVAAEVLRRVDVDAAYAAPTLDAELERARLAGRDRGLAARIVYGALRVSPELDARLAPRVRRGVDALDPFVRAVLRVAVYQLVHLGRIPPHAIVDEAVRYTKEKRGGRVGGFVNAVLRAIARELPTERVPETSLGVPPWLESELCRSMGEERARSFLEGRPIPPPIDLRSRVDGPPRDEVLARIRRARPEATVRPTHHSPLGIRVVGAGDPRKLPGHAEGHFVVQEEGSQLIALAVDAQPGETILDACAGRGGKTSLLAEKLGPTGALTAVDLHEARLEQIPKAFERLGLETPLRLEALDLAVGVGGLEERYDRVLVDAPCTGLGTIHRRPEILLRLQKEDIARLAELQAAILRNAASLVRPGGFLFYAVCSPTLGEGPDVVRCLDRGAFRPLPALDPSSFGVELERDGSLLLGSASLPSGEATDTYRLFGFQRIDSSEFEG